MIPVVDKYNAIYVVTDAPSGIDCITYETGPKFSGLTAGMFRGSFFCSVKKWRSTKVLCRKPIPLCIIKTHFADNKSDFADNKSE